MIKFENGEIVGWEAAIRGMSRNKGVRQTKPKKKREKLLYLKEYSFLKQI